jgi:uncharacterized membrane protein (UPF0182 family)
MEPTLDAALARLFGGPGAPAPADTQTTRTNTPGPAPPPQPAAAPGSTPGDLSGVAVEARGHYERAIEAQRAGDWAKYGEEIRLLGETLKRLPTR